MAVESPGAFNQNSTYGAEQTRRTIASLLARGASIGSVAGGVVTAGDLQLSAPASGMSVNIAAGEIWVPGSSSSTQSGYYCRGTSQTNLSIAASNPTNPRIDRVSALITDSAYSGGTNTFALAVETGTPTSGATLVNLSGVAAAPTSSYTLGYVLVPANAVNIVAADILNVAQGVTLGLASSLSQSNAPSSTTIVNGQLLVAAPGVTITLPSPTKNAIVGVVANGSVTVSNPVTVAGTLIYGLGLSAASSYSLGTALASTILESDGTNWLIISGTPDSLWQLLTITGTGISGSSLAYRRVGNLLYLGYTFTTATANNVSITGLPSGYQPSRSWIVPLVSTSNAANTGGAFVQITGGTGAQAITAPTASNYVGTIILPMD